MINWLVSEVRGHRHISLLILSEFEQINQLHPEIIRKPLQFVIIIIANTLLVLSQFKLKVYIIIY